MDENKTTNTNPEAGEKTFTQEQVNAIVGERLAKEKTKNEAALVQREQEIAKRELKITARERLASEGLPAELLEALNISDPETLERSIAIIKKAVKKSNNETGPQHGFKIGADSSDNGNSGSSIRRAMGLA